MPSDAPSPPSRLWELNLGLTPSRNLREVSLPRLTVRDELHGDGLHGLVGDPALAVLMASLWLPLIVLPNSWKTSSAVWL